MLEEIMKLDEESQKQICHVAISREIFTKDFFDEILIDWTDYEYAQNDALESFLHLLKRRMEEEI